MSINSSEGGGSRLSECKCFYGLPKEIGVNIKTPREGVNKKLDL